MDSILLIVTFLSLAVAIGTGLLAVKLLRDERRRSDARVAALAEMADDTAAGERQQAASIRPVAAAHRTRAEQRRASSADVPRAARIVSVDDLEIRPVASEVSVDLFVEPEQPSPWARRIAIITPMAAIIGIGLFGATAPTDSTRPDSGRSQQEDAARTSPPTALTLELLSLRHAHSARTFTVAGVVQNPRDGVPLSGIAATVAVFGPKGVLLVNGRAPLDFTTLDPGGESPFVIEVPVTETVTRYRVGFRGQNGEVIEHVDRRSTTDALARK